MIKLQRLLGNLNVLSHRGKGGKDQQVDCFTQPQNFLGPGLRIFMAASNNGFEVLSPVTFRRIEVEEHRDLKPQS
jgi:hypothetical protein